ncbi:MAG: hypothetical protein RR230_08185, partial [Oscillospiraceae bacterium]
IPPHSHSYTAEVTTPATCGTAGESTYTCVCGDSYREAIAATGLHSVTTWTEKDNANHEGACTVCGQTVTAPHDFAGGKSCPDCGALPAELSAPTFSPVSNYYEGFVACAWKIGGAEFVALTAECADASCTVVGGAISVVTREGLSPGAVIEIKVFENGSLIAQAAFTMP